MAERINEENKLDRENVSIALDMETFATDKRKFQIWLKDLLHANERLELLGDGIDKELVWKNYELHANLYKYYLELVTKHSIIYFAVTGGIVSFCFANRGQELVGYSLFFPVFMSVVYAIIYFVSANRVSNVDEEFYNIFELFGLNIVEVNVLRYVLYGSAAMYSLISAGLVTIFFTLFLH